MQRPTAVRGPRRTSRKKPSTVGGRTSGSAASASTAASQRPRPNTSSAASGTATASRIAVVTVASLSVRASACQSMISNKAVPVEFRWLQHFSQSTRKEGAPRLSLLNGCEAAFGKLSLNRWRKQVIEKLVRSRAMRRLAHDDCALLDGRVEVPRDDKVVSVGCHVRCKRGCE